MSDFEIDRERLSDHQTLLHSPSAHATPAAAATDIPNANGSPWPTRGTNPSTGVDFSQRDAQALRGESTFCQPHAIYGGMGSGTQQFMHPYAHASIFPAADLPNATEVRLFISLVPLTAEWGQQPSTSSPLLFVHLP